MGRCQLNETPRSGTHEETNKQKKEQRKNPGKKQTGQKTQSAGSPTRTKPWPIKFNKKERKGKNPEALAVALCSHSGRMGNQDGLKSLHTLNYTVRAL